MSMKRKNIQIFLFLIGILSLFMFVSSCTTPVYTKTVTTHYDAGGKLLSTTVSESISQHDSTASLMKVNITQQKRLER
jgi:hypothetical protein